MTRKRRELSGDEARLWERVASSVTPRRGRVARKIDREEDTPSKRAAGPGKTAAPTQRKNAPPPTDRSAEKRVRRGKLDIGATLDLHGHTQTTGRAALERFVRLAQGRGERVVLVVTGVGRSGEGILKRRLPEWLAEGGLRDLVSGYSKAHRTHGGEGAFYLFVRVAR